MSRPAHRAVAVASPAGRQSPFAHGPHGFSGTLFASQANNNGSALAGYTGFVQSIAGNVGAHGLPFPDLVGGVLMTFGRFVPILAVLALAGSLAQRRPAPAGPGTLRADTPTLVSFIVGFVIVFALLNSLAALCLGPPGSVPDLASLPVGGSLMKSLRPPAIS